MTLYQRLMSRVVIIDDCWLWTGTSDRLGYGRISSHNFPHLCHRVAYEVMIGPIPDGLVLDHLCRVPACINPDHLEPVTQAENMRRGGIRASTLRRHAARTHCKHGHEFTADNTAIDRKGSRVCRTCKCNDTARYRAKKAA